MTRRTARGRRLATDRACRPRKLWPISVTMRRNSDSARPLSSRSLISFLVHIASPSWTLLFRYRVLGGSYYTRIKASSGAGLPTIYIP